MRWGERPDWWTIPASVRHEIEAVLGSAVASAVTPPGGHSPQLAARLALVDGRRAFVKSVPDSSPLAETTRCEAAITAALPVEAPAPRLLASGTTAGWFTALFTDLDGRHPALFPDSPELTSVLDVLATVADLSIGGSLRTHLRGTAAVELAGYLHGWQELAQNPPADLDPWAADRLPMLTAMERERFRAVDGDSLGHSDARPDNMLFYDNQVTMVDWSHALTGAPWLDAAYLVPQLILDGWEPTTAATAVLGHHLAGSADLRDVTVFWVALTGFWQRSCRLPKPDGAPGLRPYQSAAADAGIRLLRAINE
jgi:aminoglycoside phosphotransferase (APT) family kinase protein